MGKNETEEQGRERATQWADLMAQLFDRLTGKGAMVSYGFRNLEIDIPKAAGPQGQTLGSAKWVVNGEIVIKAQAQSTGDIE
ncbi:MAG TPA: hypothetical protein VFR94_23635 [Nitrososphaeraceae archaeon]|nr:hypothetical protein [Nitrososphaeraceae archaeon]